MRRSKRLGRERDGFFDTSYQRLTSIIERGTNGGFFMLYTTPADRRRVYAALSRGLRPLPFRFDTGGARIAANLRQL